MSSITVELVGGREDGRTFSAPESVLKTGIVLPRSAQAAPSFSGNKNDPDFVEFEREQWRWDGSRGRQGNFRFRMMQ